MGDLKNDLGHEDFAPVAEAVGRMRAALDGLTVAHQLAALSQVTGYVLMAAEHTQGREIGKTARTTYATMLRNVCVQWRRAFRAGRS